MMTATPMRRGSALLLVLFLMAVTAPLLVMLLDAQATHTRCVHNDISLRTALYVAEAGVQRAMAELLATPGWRDGFTDQESSPGSGHTYTVTLSDTPEADIEIVSTSRTSDGYTKTATVVVEGF